MSIAELIAKTVRRYELTVKANSNKKAPQEITDNEVISLKVL
jgi:hypothetical protein